MKSNLYCHLFFIIFFFSSSISNFALLGWRRPQSVWRSVFQRGVPSITTTEGPDPASCRGVGVLNHVLMLVLGGFVSLDPLALEAFGNAWGLERGGALLQTLKNSRGRSNLNRYPAR